MGLWGGELAPHLTQLRDPRPACSRPQAPPRSLEQRSSCGRGVGDRGWARGPCRSQPTSVVKLALARLVDEAALVLGPAWTALAGAVLPL